jgi:two-component system nitrate/nitrite sensor histidine kinase NarX
MMQATDPSPAARDVLTLREDAWRRLFAEAPDAMVLFDQEGTILDVNEAGCALVGYRREELIGRSGPTLLAQSASDRVTRTFNRVRAGNVELAEWCLRRKDGTEVRTETSTKRLSDGRWIAIGRDVAALRQLEEASRAPDAPVQPLATELPDLVLIHDLRTQNLVYVNRNNFLGYSTERLRQGRLSLEDVVHPDDIAAVRTRWESVSPETTAADLEYRIRTRDGDWEWIQERATVLSRSEGGHPHFLLTRITQISRQKRIQEWLKEANRALNLRVSELALVNQIGQLVSSVVDLPEALRRAGRLIAEGFHADEVEICELDERQNLFPILARIERVGDELIDGPSSPTLSPARIRAFRRAINEDRALLFEPASADAPAGLLAKRKRGSRRRWELYVPLRTHGRVIGGLRVVAQESLVRISSSAGDTLETIAGALASAIDTARLLREEQRRRQVAEVLQEVEAVVSSSLEHDTVLAIILNQLGRVLDFDGGQIWLLEAGTLTCAKAIGLSEPVEGAEMPAGGRSALGRVLKSSRTLVLRGLRTHPRVRGRIGEGRLRTWMGTPLAVGDRTLGVLGVFLVRPGQYGPEDIHVIQTFAAQAAIAIENARRYRLAERVGADAERNRIARDLHDSVVQSLLSAKLIAEVIPSVWERDPLAAREGFAKMSQFSKSAMAEMRNLLVELRPATLTSLPLHELAAHLVEAFRLRTGVSVTTRLDHIPILPPEVQVGFYRVLQEALNNIQKHAGARNLAIQLQAAPPLRRGLDSVWRGTITAHLADDGRGFDPQQVGITQFGLAIMRERANAIGAALLIASRAGKGTQISITWRGRAARREGEGNGRNGADPRLDRG